MKKIIGYYFTLKYLYFNKLFSNEEYFNFRHFSIVIHVIVLYDVNF